ncbi:hypothetical protein XBJ2_60053 [Xenorhabdus bovienii str. Jollieti]|uniref:Uncharacterized protein n=1 Tax=Xenorhabdus bovienii (strain SS-2004) TaxID=406818 RepID=D3UYH7_XENBS|nr:hypothetical protein XBJ1_0204 [Xenorhabdus bovienii SS-2004]CDH30197.1 hypothetical protein XBJ2_60053 [Xenorhabdus bovienii str. Jollieti]
MDIKHILTNNQFRSILTLYKITDNRIRNSDSLLVDEPDIVRIKDKITSANESAQKSLCYLTH